MIHVKELILVEGKYDKNTLAQIVDAMIIETSGFGIFHDEKKMHMIRELASKNGVIIFTDSDSAGFLIRNHLKGALPPNQIKNAYTPDLYGKEKRKKIASKEGKLGVEGMRPEMILDCLKRAGATMEELDSKVNDNHSIKKSDLYKLGLSGQTHSDTLRSELKRELDLPENLSATGLLDVLNVMISLDELEQIMKKLKRRNLN